MAMVTVATLLPFLILSWASPLFRERLTALLQMTSECELASQLQAQEPEPKEQKIGA